MNTPKTIEERIKEFGNKLAFELKPSNDTMEAVRLMREKLPELLAEQNRISRESERERISKRLDKLARYGTTIHTTPPNFWAYKCEDVEDLLQTNKE